MLSPQQAIDLQQALAYYWKNKGKKRSVKKEIEEMIVLLAQAQLNEFNIVMQNFEEDELG